LVIRRNRRKDDGQDAARQCIGGRDGKHSKSWLAPALPRGIRHGAEMWLVWLSYRLG